MELVTSSFRFGSAPEAATYRRRELFYPVSSRVFRSRSPLRLPVKAVEHGIGLTRLRGLPRDVLHVQWAPLPQLDRRLLSPGPRSVITAHDILPRRTAEKRELWRSLYQSFSAVVAHSDRGRGRLINEVGVDEERITVIPHPAFPGTPRYDDDGATLLFLGMIRPYKQLDHAIELARRVGARLLVVGDPTFDLGARRHLPGVEWRLGYANDVRIDAALAETTVALFPYREELDQSGALLRALGAGVAVVAYDVGGIAEPVSRFGAGVVAPPDDLDALTDGVQGLLGDPTALETAREGAREAARTLTWEASAVAHIGLYEELPR